VRVLSEECGERFHRDVSGMEKRYRESGFHRCKQTVAGREQERFSETCVHNEGKETALLIKASQSVSIMSRILCVRHLKQVI
jgi:hypothetical protein